MTKLPGKHTSFLVFLCLVIFFFLEIGYITFRNASNTPQTTSRKTLFPGNTTIPAQNAFPDGKLSREDLALLSNFRWPKLTPYRPDDVEREIYLVDCEVTNDRYGFKLEGIPQKISNNGNVAESAIIKLLENHYGGFPDAPEITNYEIITGTKFKNKDSGVNGVLLKNDGTLAINFTDSVRAYGGGSSRVSCMGLAAELTLKQFPFINDIIMCIDKYPDSLNRNCAYDFQP